MKKLRKDVEERFPTASADDLRLLLPAKADLTVAKLSNKAVVYSLVGGNPLFFEPEGRGELLPTVYALWACPALLPPVLTYSEVSPKVSPPPRDHFQLTCMAMLNCA